MKQNIISWYIRHWQDLSLNIIFWYSAFRKMLKTEGVNKRAVKMMGGLKKNLGNECEGSYSI